MIVLDTNVMSALMRAPDNPGVVAWLDRQPQVTVWTTAICVMEVRFGLRIMPAGRRKEARIKEFERILADELQNRILPFDSDAAEHTARLMDRRHKAGRAGELRDTMIAGIALAQNATLATRNVKHFSDTGVAIVDPWQA